MSELGALQAISGLLLAIVLGSQIKMMRDVTDIRRRFMDCPYCNKGRKSKED